MDDAGAVLHRDEVAGDDAAGRQRVVFAAPLGQLRPVEAVGGDAPSGRFVEALVGRADQLGAVDRGDGAEFFDLAERLREQLFGGDDPLALAHFGDGVALAGGDGEAGVGGQRPGRRGPGEDVGAPVPAQGFGQRLRDGGEANVDAGVDGAVLVAERDLVAGKRGLAARAVRRRPPRLVDQARVPERLEDPPAGLDVVGRVGAVGVAGIDPERDPVGQLLPLLDVGHDGFAAAAVELGDAELLDLGFRAEPELALDFELDRQAVGIPAALAGRAAAAHGLVAREEVLEGAGEHVVYPGLAVGRGRALVEGIEAVGGALLDGALEDALALPPIADARLEFGVRHHGADGSESGFRHAGIPRCGGRAAARAQRGGRGPRSPVSCSSAPGLAEIRPRRRSWWMPSTWQGRWPQRPCTSSIM